MIKILAIGNSFSQDATAYLHDIAKAGQVELKVVNLYIGGCSLETHWTNAQVDEAAYEYELNGQYNGRKVSIKEALLEDSWDYVTLQQVSGDSGLIATYYPYIKDLHNYVTEYAPQAKQLIHQTWAYEINSDHSAFANYGCNQVVMYEALKDAYHKIARELSLEMIPCGTVIQTLRKNPVFDYTNGGISLCRDGFHMNLIYGRYAVAATWYEYLAHRSILTNSYLPPEVNEEYADPVRIKIIQDIVHQIASDK